MVLEGENAVVHNRKLMGATDPKNAEENTIRKLYGISIDRNSVHGSDSLENAKKESGVPSWYSAWKALNNMLMYENYLDKDDKYDIVVRIRPDIIIPKCELKRFKHLIQRTFENPKLISSFYNFPNDDMFSVWGNPEHFPIIDYYQIGSKKNIVNLHKWVYNRILNRDVKFNKYFWNIRDDFEINDMIHKVKMPQAIIIRNLMADKTYLSSLFNKWSNEDMDIQGIMLKWYGLPNTWNKNRKELYHLDESVIHKGLHDIKVSKEEILEQTYNLI